MIAVPAKQTVTATPVVTPTAAPQTTSRPTAKADKTLVICTCRAQFTVPTSARGSQQRCPTCKRLVLVPSTSGALDNLNVPSSSSLSRLPPSTPMRHPYTRTPSKPVSNKPIIVTAAIGFSLLVLLVAGTFSFQLLTAGRQAADDTSVESEASTAEAPADTQADPYAALVEDLAVSEEMAESTASDADTPQKPSDADSAPSDPMETNTTASPVRRPPTGRPTRSTSAPRRLNPDAARDPVQLPPPSEEGLVRVHTPDGYSFAVPAGFQAAPRQADNQSVQYLLAWPDGTTFGLKVIERKGTHPSGRALPHPTILTNKLVVQPRMRADDPDQIEVVSVNGMNASFSMIQEDIGHKDMSKEIQLMFSGAMPPEAKRRFAPLMQEKKAWRAGYVMRALSDDQILHGVIFGIRESKFQPPAQWYEIMRTVRREKLVDTSLVPPPFERKR